MWSGSLVLMSCAEIDAVLSIEGEVGRRNSPLKSAALKIRGIAKRHEKARRSTFMTRSSEYHDSKYQ